MRTPDTFHLSREDAELVRALYLERHRGISRGEADRVRADAARTVPTRTATSRHARHAA